MRNTLRLLILLILFSAPANGQNRINKSKQQLNQKQSSSNLSSPRSATSSSSSGSGSSSLLGGLVYGVFTYTVGITLFGGYSFEGHLHNKQTEYPFYIPEHGNYFNHELHPNGNVTNFRLDLKDKFMYSSSSLIGNHLEAKIRPFQYFYVKADYYQLFEFQEQEGTSDQLSLFYFNFAYDRIRLSRFNFGWTLGASYIAGDVNKAGFAFGLNAEYFSKRNVSFLAGAKWSGINGQPVNAYEIEGRFHKKNWFASIGCEHLDIGSPNYNFVTIGGGAYF